MQSEELRQVKKIVYGVKPPYPNLVFDVGEKWYDGKPRYAFIRLYRDNYEEFSEDQRVGIALWISETIKLCRQAVGPAVYLEVAESVPRI